MATVVVSWTTKQVAFPEGVVAGKTKVSLNDPRFQPQEVDAGPVTFLDVPAGSYVATVVKLDDKKQDLGAPALSSEFVIAPPVVTEVQVDVPDVVNVVVE